MLLGLFLLKTVFNKHDTSLVACAGLWKNTASGSQRVVIMQFIARSRAPCSISQPLCLLIKFILVSWAFHQTSVFSLFLYITNIKRSLLATETNATFLFTFPSFRPSVSSRLTEPRKQVLSQSKLFSKKTCGRKHSLLMSRIAYTVVHLHWHSRPMPLSGELLFHPLNDVIVFWWRNRDVISTSPITWRQCFYK